MPDSAVPPHAFERHYGDIDTCDFEFEEGGGITRCRSSSAQHVALGWPGAESVVHFANHDLELRVVWKSPKGEVPYGGTPAMCAYDNEHWYGGEIKDGQLWYVNSYGDEFSAFSYARSLER